MPSFLTTQQLYRMIQRELPEDAYPDGAPNAFNSTADSYSTAKQFADAYTNLLGIYNNYFPQDCDDRIDDWEMMVFGKISSSMTLDERQAAVLFHLQHRPGITVQDMKDIILFLIPSIGAGNIEISEWNQPTGGWMLGYSQLGVETYIGSAREVDLTSSLYPSQDICGAEIASNPGEFGLTSQQLADAQLEAYTYDVRIYGYTLNADQLAAVDAALSKGEPARSQHMILSGLLDSQRLSGST